MYPIQNITDNGHVAIRVLVADDHVTVLEGLVAIVGRQVDMTVVAQATNGQQAVEMWREYRPDVTLMDLRLPILDGLGAIEAIRCYEPEARILVLTCFDTDTDLSKAISAGAQGYLLKDAPREELLASIRSVYCGETSIPASLLCRLTTNLSNEPLTRRELDVLALLAYGKSNKEIGKNLFISETTVKSHLRSIFAKLKVLSRTEAITVAHRRGLIQL